uniref:Cerato-platanin 5 n=1 Tax=Crinipellis campanella TaxID=34447 RepID=S4UPN1_9AGAR|nr:cerato-platanin 5 [Crinipellis campanella]
MKLLSLSASLSLVSAAVAVNLGWDNAYDGPSTSLDTVACSNGENGLETRFGFSNLSQIPTFPFVGGAPDISGFNSPACATCWELTYTNSTGIAQTVHFTAIDAGGDDFVTGEGALNSLTNGQAEQLGIIPVTATVVNASACGL